MTEANIISKVQKLLRLSTSSNAHEAALAAAKAQELIDQHNLQSALLELESAAPRNGLDDEPIEKFEADRALDRPVRLDRWRAYLAQVVGKANGCSIYLSGGAIALVGRPSDAETVRYLYAYLAREVERLTTEQGKGCGKTWRNNFRNGVVDTIARKLDEQHAKFEREARASVADNSMALVRVNQALATVEAKRTSVETWVKTNMKLRSTRSSSTLDRGARASGRAAGESISVGGAAGARGLSR
jgi:hypothetical protein